MFGSGAGGNIVAGSGNVIVGANAGKGNNSALNYMTAVGNNALNVAT
jgi:hypothetical protein